MYVPGGEIEGTSGQIDINLTGGSVTIGSTVEANPKPVIGVGFGPGKGVSSSITTTGSVTVGDVAVEVVMIPARVVIHVLNLFR